MRTSEARRLPIDQRVRWARKRKGISQERLASLIGTSRRHLIRIEKGQHAPGLEFRARIAAATDQTVDFFIDGDGEDDEEDAALARELFLIVKRIMVRERERVAA